MGWFDEIQATFQQRPGGFLDQAKAAPNHPDIGPIRPGETRDQYKQRLTAAGYSNEEIANIFRPPTPIVGGPNPEAMRQWEQEFGIQPQPTPSQPTFRMDPTQPNLGFDGPMRQTSTGTLQTPQQTSYTSGPSGGGASAGAGSFGNLSDPNAWMGIASDPSKSFQWIKSNYPDIPDDVAQYYAGVIQGQPGANPTEQAGSAQYYLNMIRDREYNGNQYVGSAAKQGGMGGGMMGGGYSLGGGPLASFSAPGLAAPWTQEFQAPSLEQIQNDPQYKFQLQQGNQALQRSAAAKGTLLSGGTLKDIEAFSQGLASDFADKAYNRALGIYDRNQNTWYRNQDGAFNKLHSLGQMGLQGATATGNFGSDYAGNVRVGANNAGDLITSQGDANAGATLSGNQSSQDYWKTMLNNAGQIDWTQLLRKTKPSTTASPYNPDGYSS